MEIIKFYKGGYEETKKYKLYKVVANNSSRTEYYEEIKEEMDKRIDDLNNQLVEQQQINKINSNSILEVYESMLSEGENL